MKRRIVAAMLAGVMALGMLAGCGGSGKSDSDGGSSDKKSSDANIAVFYYTYSDTYIASVRTALDAKLDEMGVEYQDYDGNSNQTTQNEQIDTAIQTGANVLIVNIVTSGSVDASSQIVEKAKAAGLPNDNIKRAIEKGSGAGNNENYDEMIYEGYAAGGVAVVIEAMTDNKNRTAGDIRSYFTKFNGNLGETGCVGWMFDKKGCITFNKDDVDYEKLFEAAINLDAEDIVEEDDEYKPETVSFKINPLITKFFKANAGDTEYNADDVLCRLKQENLLKDILRWEKINYGYEKCAAKYSDTPDKETLNVLDSLKETKEAIELELQRSNVMLGSKNGITVKISSDI